VCFLSRGLLERRGEAVGGPVRTGVWRKGGFLDLGELVLEEGVFAEEASELGLVV
jgi:hypothetical protein